MPKYTLQELKEKDIAIKCDSQADFDRVIEILNITPEETYNSRYNVIKFWGSDINPLLVWEELANDRTIIPASEFFLEDDPKSTPEPIPLESAPASIPTEYAVLTNATESAKKQIAEFEQELAQIKIDAMKLGTRDLARLIKALKVI